MNPRGFIAVVSDQRRDWDGPPNGESLPEALAPFVPPVCCICGEETCLVGVYLPKSDLRALPHGAATPWSGWGKRVACVFYGLCHHHAPNEIVRFMVEQEVLARFAVTADDRRPS
jgi:hypothetical protein